jgi:peptidyl-tRNA hydrolase
VQVAQTIHAAGESVREQVPPSTRAVALAVSDEEELLRLEAELQRLGIPHTAIREPDAPFNGALMALGIVPTVRTPTVRRALGRLSLLR